MEALISLKMTGCIFDGSTLSKGRDSGWGGLALGCLEIRTSNTDWSSFSPPATRSVVLRMPPLHLSSRSCSAALPEQADIGILYY